MSINRNVLGRGRGGFRVTSRSTTGANLRLQTPDIPTVPTPQRPRVEARGVPMAEQGYVPMAPTFDNRYDSGANMGYADLQGPNYAGSEDPFGMDDGLGAFVRDFNPAAVLSGITSGITSQFSLPGDPDGQGGQFYGDDAPDPFADSEYGGYESPRVPGRKDKADNNERGNAAATARLEGLAGKYLEDQAAPDADQIQAAIDTGIAQFEVEKALLEAKREGALADGLEGVADEFGDRILQHEKAIQKMRDEIALTNDIEGWYRKRIKDPYEQAIRAAEEIDFQKTLAVQSKYRNEQAKSLADMEDRLNGVLGDIGFTPDQIENFQGERVLDNEVTAAQNALLEASGVRKGELDWEKKLKASMAEEEWMRSNRQSSGRQMIVAEQNRKAIGETQDRIGELDKLKQKAMDRVRRAVDREFQGAEFPSKDEFVNAALESMRGDLYGDLPPAAQEMYDEVIGAFINSGKTFSQQTLVEMLANGELQIPGVSDALGEAYSMLEDEWERAARAADEAGVSIPEFPQAEWERMAREIVNDNIDAEDRGIIKGMVDTYNGAVEQYGRYTEERVTRNYSNAENANPENIADAKAGQGIYGERAKVVSSMVPVIEGMWGVSGGGRVTDIQGENYFRPSEDPAVERKKGRSPNSDHKTAGALDLFLDANDPQDMAYFRNVIEPQLRIWQDQGLISSYVPLGGNHAHMDHTHVSFALGSMNDQGYDPNATNDQTNNAIRENIDHGLNPFMGGM